MSTAPEANYYAIKAAHDSIGPFDTIWDGEEAKYRRFEAFWGTRVETGNPAVSGLLSNYSTKLSTYFDGPFCPTNVNPMPWQQMGPDHYTPQHLGRVQAMWVDPVNDPPQLIYSGTTHSGLWRSIDGATTWTNITDSYPRPVHGVHAIARITDLTPARLIIGTGRQDDESFSLGALYSDDDGITWQACVGIPTTASDGPVVDIKVYGNEVLALRGKKLFRSVDHGLNFVEISPTASNIIGGIAPDGTNHFCGVVHFQNANNGVIVLAAKERDGTSANGADLYASTDLGLSWIRITDQLPIGTILKLSQVCIVNDPGGPYHGFHILVEGDIAQEARLFSGTDPTQIQLTQIFNSNSCLSIAHRGFNYRYDNFAITKHGRVYTSEVKDIYGAQLSPNGCQSITLNYYSWSPLSHDDLNTFVILSGATASEDRIAVGHDGGMSYRPVSGIWQDWNGLSFPTVLGSHIAVDEFASRIVMGALDNGTWMLRPGVSNWNKFSYISDGGMSSAYRNKDGSTEAWSYIENRTAKLKVVIAGQSFSRNHTTVEGFRLRWPSVIRNRNSEPTLFFVHEYGTLQSGLMRMDRNGPAIPLTSGPGYMYDCAALDIHPHSADHIFYGIYSRYWWPSTDPSFRLMRSSDGGTSWQDLSANLTNPNSPDSDQNVFSRYGVNTVAIDPDSDPNSIAQQIVYVGMAGIPDVDGFERVFKSTDGGQSWTDLSIGLPGFPVNYLVCQPGSGGVVYAATDVGVFIYKPDIGEWQCFNAGFPICIVTGLEVNMCSGKLYASTYGRSSWQTDLYIPPVPTERIISADLSIGDLVTSSTLRVSQGATLTITGSVDFHERTKLIIEPGARVIVDGGTLSSRCPTFWAGIDIIGDNSHNQLPSNHPTHQGKLVLMNGATIEHAREINVRGPNWNSFGGVIQATDANFINCRRSAQFMAYQNTNAGGFPISNASFFTRCTFTVNDDYRGGDDFYAHVSLWKVDGIRFTACTFENLQTTITESAKLGQGIVSLDASYKVRGACATAPPWPGGTCPTYTPTTFRGLDHGIDARNFGTTRNFIVDRCLFEDNVCGVYANGVIGFQVKNSQFKVGGNDVAVMNNAEEIYWNGRHRGVFSTESWGFAIDDNTFDQQGANPLTEGIVVGYTREHDEVVFRNQATGLESGFVGEGISADVANGYAATRGLWFLCNNNTNNHNNFWARVVINADPFEQAEHTIRLNQGLPSRPADNTFDQWASGSADLDFRVSTTNSPMLYWHRSGGTYVPTNYTIGITGIAPVPVTSTPANNCASKILPPIPWPPPPDEMPTVAVKNYLLSEKMAYANTRYLFEQLIDDGNTDEVVQEIESSWPQDAWELRAYLLSKSPYLSVTTLKEMVLKAILPNAMVTEILVANPEATRQDRYLDWLQNKSGHPLPQYMLDLVVASWDQRTYRTTLETELTRHHAEMTQTGNTLIHHYSSMAFTEDENAVVPTDEIMWVWQQVRTPASRYAEAMLLMQDHHFEAATTVIEGMPAEHNLKTPGTLERQRMLDLIDFMGAMWNNGKNELQLETSEVQVLKNMMGAHYDRPATWISNLLCFAYNDCRPPLTGGVEDGLKTLRPASTPQQVAPVEPELTIHPNPANSWVAFDYDLLVEPTDAFLVIRDMIGKEVYRMALRDRKQQLVWDTRNAAPGSYTIHLLNKERDLRTEKLIIQQ